MIAAFARAGFIFGEKKYIEAAERAAGFISSQLTDGNGRLMARWRQGEAAIDGKLDDYAFYVWGLLELYSACFDIRYLSEALRLAGLMVDLFWDGENGGFYPYSSDGEQLITRNKESYDGALPSGNSVAGLVLSRLARLTGESRWAGLNKRQLSYLAGAAKDHPSGHSLALTAFQEELWPSCELVAASRKLPKELINLLREEPHMGLTVLVKTPENEKTLSRLAPFTADYPIPAEGQMYYLCRGKACESPVDSIEKLKRLLRQ